MDDFFIILKYLSNKRTVPYKSFGYLRIHKIYLYITYHQIKCLQQKNTPKIATFALLFISVYVFIRGPWLPLPFLGPLLFIPNNGLCPFDD